MRKRIAKWLRWMAGKLDDPRTIEARLSISKEDIERIVERVRADVVRMQQRGFL